MMDVVQFYDVDEMQSNHFHFSFIDDYEQAVIDDTSVHLVRHVENKHTQTHKPTFTKTRDYESLK